MSSADLVRQTDRQTDRAERGRADQMSRQDNGSSRWSDVNISQTERLVSMLGGGALALYGLTRGTLGGFALALGGGYLAYRGLSGHCSLYEAAGLNTAEQHGPATSVAAGHGVKVEQSITIDAPAAELYKFWRDLENLPKFMKHLKSVKVADGDGKRSHWVAEGPLGTSAEWDAEIINERENELIAWRSLEGSTVDTAGSVHFDQAPGGRGTEVKVTLKYEPPGGQLGATVAWLFGRSPSQEIAGELRRLKQLVETGEVATVEGQTSCRKG